MSASSRRAADRERQAAAILGTERIKRSRFEKAADVKLVVLEDGTMLQPEIKTRKKLPTYLAKALAQAASYAPKGAVPVAVISEHGGSALVVLDARSFARIAGITKPEPTDQLTLPSSPPEPTTS